MERGPAKEIYKEIEGIHTEKSLVHVGIRAIQEQYEREDRDRNHDLQRRKVFHRDRKSSSRSASASSKGAEKIEQLNEEIHNNQVLIRNVKEVDAAIS